MLRKEEHQRGNNKIKQKLLFFLFLIDLARSLLKIRMATIVMIMYACVYIFCINIESILKGKEITLPTKVHIVKAIAFLVVMYGTESWTVKKTEF